MSTTKKNTYDFINNKNFQISDARKVIANEIKKSIITGRLIPGERIRTQAIADLFSVSRTPVREALRQLESIGLITMIPDKGAFVSDISHAALDSHSLRFLLEPPLLEKTIENINSTQLQSAKKISEKLQSPTTQDNFDLYIAFHTEIYRNAKSEKLFKSTLTLISESEWLWHRNKNVVDAVKLAYYPTLLKLLQKKDYSKAKDLLLAHLNALKNNS